jgi:hypothetical protein
MLSTVFSAEVQFRHDSETQARELAILESIRDRREAPAARPRPRVAVRRPASWPRPIGVRLDLADSSAAACA